MMVNVRFVNFAAPGKRYGSIKTVEGQTIFVRPDMVGLFRQGMVCEIGTKEEIWSNGPVVIATTGPSGQAAPQQGYQQGGGQQGRQQWNGSQRSRQSFQPRVYQGGQGGGQQQQYQLPKTPEEQREIFVTGVVGRAMGSGKFVASEITVLTQGALHAYDQLVRPKPAPPVADYSSQQQANVGFPQQYGHQSNQINPGYQAGTQLNQEPPSYEQGDPGPQEPVGG